MNLNADRYWHFAFICFPFLSQVTYPFSSDFFLFNLLDNCKIALFNTALSIQNFRAAMEVPAALGLDPTVANSGAPTA